MRAQASRSPSSGRHWPAVAVAAIVAAATLAPVPVRANPAAAAAEIVDCKLPPQIHTLGRNVTYLAAGRVVRVSVTECKQRGGTWHGGGPGAYAGANLSTGAKPGAPLAVTVGGDAKTAACPLQASVGGLSPGSTLAVRNGPGTGFERIDRLANGKRVFACDRAGDAGWVGIVYPTASGVDCGLSAPIATPHAYAGSCRSGWVRSNYLR